MKKWWGVPELTLKKKLTFLPYSLQTSKQVEQLNYFTGFIVRICLKICANQFSIFYSVKIVTLLIQSIDLPYWKDIHMSFPMCVNSWFSWHGKRKWNLYKILWDARLLYSFIKHIMVFLPVDFHKYFTGMPRFYSSTESTIILISDRL